MDTPFHISVHQPSGSIVEAGYFTRRQFRLACQRLLSRSDVYRRVVQTSHHAKFEPVNTTAAARSEAAQRPASGGLSLS